MLIILDILDADKSPGVSGVIHTYSHHAWYSWSTSTSVVAAGAGKANKSSKLYLVKNTTPCWNAKKTGNTICCAMMRCRNALDRENVRISCQLIPVDPRPAGNQLTFGPAKEEPVRAFRIQNHSTRKTVPRVFLKLGDYQWLPFPKKTLRKWLGLSHLCWGLQVGFLDRGTTVIRRCGTSEIPRFWEVWSTAIANVY